MFYWSFTSLVHFGHLHILILATPMVYTFFTIPLVNSNEHVHIQWGGSSISDLAAPRLPRNFSCATSVCGSVAERLGRWTWDDAICRSRVRLPASPLSSATLGKLLTHMCLCHQAV